MYLHVVVRNITEKFCLNFAHFPPKVIFCKMIVKYHNQDTDIDRVLILFQFPQFYLYLLVCVTSIQLVTCISLFMRHYNQVKCSVLIQVRITFMTMYPPGTPNPQSHSSPLTTKVSFISKIYHFTDVT